MLSCGRRRIVNPTGRLTLGNPTPPDDSVLYDTFRVLAVGGVGRTTCGRRDRHTISHDIMPHLAECEPRELERRDAAERAPATVEHQRKAAQRARVRRARKRGAPTAAVSVAGGFVVVVFLVIVTIAPAVDVVVGAESPAFPSHRRGATTAAAITATTKVTERARDAARERVDISALARRGSCADAAARAQEPGGTR